MKRKLDDAEKEKNAAIGVAEKESEKLKKLYIEFRRFGHQNGWKECKQGRTSQKNNNPQKNSVVTQFKSE